jgi:DNA polymerase-3 subunit gamma/tau
MNYQVTARKWRPQTFSSIIGQENLVRAIQNALSSGKIPHAFLFSGVRGVGKTTTARVIAKALNCKTPKGLEPCNECSSCTAITGGNSLDVIEIDGASNRGIDNIREIKDNVSFMPLSGKYKVYIIDEVHMLTTEASNALLKTLEEPPEHVVFILATTEAYKVLSTIKSRCQHYLFKKIPIKTIVTQLKNICDSDHISYTEEGLYLIANAADGSLRDAESLFDQVFLYSDGNINEESASELIGIPDKSYFIRMIDSILKKDAVLLLRTLNEYLDQIGDIKIFVKTFIHFLKEGLLVKSLEPESDLLDFSTAQYHQMKSLFEPFSPEELVKLMSLFIDLFKDLKGESQERFLLEITLFKALDYQNIIPLSELRNEMLSFLKKNEKPSPQVAPTEKPISVYKIPVEEKKEQAGPVEAVNQNLSPVSESEAKNTLISVLSESMLMKPMISSIKEMRFSENRLTVEIDSSHTFEYLNQHKSELQNKVSNYLKRNISIHFDLGAEKQELQKSVFTEKIALQPEKPKAVPEMADAVINLFDGKIE